MNPREFFDRYIRGWLPAEPKMQKHWPIKPIATIVVVSISFSIVISLISSFFFASSAIVTIFYGEKAYGGTSGDIANSLVQASDGGYAIVGYTYSFGVRDQDAWLVKTDASGNMEWNRTYGREENSGAFSLVAASDGGYAIIGYKRSSKCWLVKTDEFGNMQWNQTYGGEELDSAGSLVETSDGGYAMAGFTTSLGNGEADFWLVKTDEYGNVQEPEQESQP